MRFATSGGHGLGCVGMKVRMSHVQPRVSAYPGNDQARMEIQSFLQALASYPATFAKDPGISFEQHFSRLVSAGLREPRSSN